MNINCPGCNFGYKLDERRIPPSGQKMRCPKCSTSFRINNEGIVSNEPSTVEQSPFRGTLPSMPPVLDAPESQIDDPFGDSSQSAPTETDDIWDRSPKAANASPTTTDPFADPIAPLADPFADPVAPLPDPFAGAELPTVKGEVDLPTPVGHADLPTPIDNVDLPAPLGHSDLPTPLEDSDLPTPLGESDLPMPIGHSDYPTPKTDAGIPSPADTFPVPESIDPFGDIGFSAEDDPFGGESPLPSPANAPKRTLLGAGSFTKPQANASVQNEDDFDIPSPADFASVTPAPGIPGGNTIPMSPPETTPNSGDDFGNIDLQANGIPSEPPPPPSTSRTSGAGSTDFGQIDFANGQSEDSGEFDAFPVQEESEEDESKLSSQNSDSLDLADAPIREQITEASFGGLSKDTDGDEGIASDAAGQIGGSFEGRRKYERQTRKSKVVIMLVLLLIGASGGALHFTPYGVFGVNYLVSLLPNASADEIVKSAFSSTMRSVDQDSYIALNTAITELEITRQELPQNEDLRLIGVYLHSWHQLRYGISARHEKAALKLLGNIKLDSSESQYASIVKSTRAILSDKSQKVIGPLSRKPKLSSNEAALLIIAYHKTNAPEKALQIAEKTAAERNTPRFTYLQALSSSRANQIAQAKSLLETHISKAPNHYDARLLLAKLLVSEKEKDSKKVTALLNPINEADDDHASQEQKASVHSVIGTMLFQRRKYDEAKKEFFKAKTLNPKDPLMLTGSGRLSLMHGDLPGAMTQFRGALIELPNDRDAQIGIASTLIQQDKTQEAQSILSPLFQTHPNNPTIHYLTGVIAQGIKQYDKALASYQKAIELDSEYIEAFVAMATVYMETEKTNEAMKTLDAASAAVPGSALIKLTLADGHAANEDYPSAVISLNEALEIEPDNPIIHFKMAQMYRKMEELEDAQNALDEVVRLDPSFPGLSVEQGFLMELSGKIGDALKTYEDALKKNPDDISAKTRVAAASIYQEDYDRAKELLVEVLNENPDSADGNFYMGEIFRAEKSSADAIPYLKNATELDPNNPLYFVRYGAALAMMHDVGKANQQYNKALALDPKMAEIYLRMGELKLHSGSVKTAIEQFEKSLELNPQIPNAHLLIGKAYEELADLKSAALYYQKSTKAFPNNPDGFFQLGKMYLQTKGNRGAIAPLKVAIRLAQDQNQKPNWLTDAYYHLGSAQKATGERGGAIASFKKYLEIAPEDAIDRSEVKASLDDLLY